MHLQVLSGLCCTAVVRTEALAFWKVRNLHKFYVWYSYVMFVILQQILGFLACCYETLLLGCQMNASFELVHWTFSVCRLDECEQLSLIENQRKSGPHRSQTTLRKIVWDVLLFWLLILHVSFVLIDSIYLIKNVSKEFISNTSLWLFILCI